MLLGRITFGGWWSFLLRCFFQVGHVPGLPFLLVLAKGKGSVVSGESYLLAFQFISMAVARSAHDPFETC